MKQVANEHRGKAVLPKDKKVLRVEVFEGGEECTTSLVAVFVRASWKTFELVYCGALVVADARQFVVDKLTAELIQAVCVGHD